jgi:CspA family cold shock protein
MRVMGTVKWFDLLRGFGVIRREPGESDCFVRHAAMRGSLHHPLATCDRVEFDVIQGGAGAVARDVIRLDAAVLPLILKAV